MVDLLQGGPLQDGQVGETMGVTLLVEGDVHPSYVVKRRVGVICYYLRFYARLLF